jgi:hypothetical protein
MQFNWLLSREQATPALPAPWSLIIFTASAVQGGSLFVQRPLLCAWCFVYEPSVRFRAVVRSVVFIDERLHSWRLSQKSLISFSPGFSRVLRVIRVE